MSVLLPVKDAASTLGQTLDSLLAQTLADFEIVAVDDGSRDGTATVLAGYAARDARVRVVAANATGLVPALNQGFSLCRGHFIGRMDADDVASPRRLEAQVKWLREHPEVGVVSCLVDVEGIGAAPPGAGMLRYVAWLNSVQTPEAIAAARFIESPVAHPTVMLRQQLLHEHGRYREGPFPEDYELWLRLLAAGVRFAKVPEVLLTWRDHPTRTSRTDLRYDRDRFREVKIRYLLEGPLAARPTIIFVGAGIDGKPFLRAFLQAGLHVPYVVEIDPRKLGQRIHGALVVPPAHLPNVLAAHPGALVLAAVGVPEAREVIRAMLTPMALEEGRTSFFLR